MDLIKILIVDDQKLFAASLKTVLENTRFIGEVHIASSGKEAVSAMENQPDLILMDVNMPGMDGIETTRSICERFPGTKVLMLTAFGYSEYIKEAIKAGASGYVLKDVLPAKLIQHIRDVMDGALIIPSKSVTAPLEQDMAGSQDSTADSNLMMRLTNKERKILYLISKGYSNNEISESLNLGNQTIRNYISTLYVKIGVSNRFEAMRAGIEGGIDRFIKIV